MKDKKKFNVWGRELGSCLDFFFLYEIFIRKRKSRHIPKPTRIQ